MLNELLSSHLLQLRKIARDIPPGGFLDMAVRQLQLLIPFEKAWWGLGEIDLIQNEPMYHQSGFINLPPSIAKDYRQVSKSFESYVPYPPPFWGKPQRHERDPLALSEEMLAYCDRYQITYALHICIEEPRSKQVFFTTLFRGHECQQFSDDEMSIFAPWVRHVLQMWEFALEDHLSRDASGGINKIALARKDGYLLFAGSEFCELIQSRWPEWSGIYLPNEVKAKFEKLPHVFRMPQGLIDITAHGLDVRLARLDHTSDALLSPRERRVAHLFATGNTYKEIAKITELSPSTVRTYIRNAYVRLGVRSKLQLIDVLKVTEGC